MVRAIESKNIQSSTEKTKSSSSAIAGDPSARPPHLHLVDAPLSDDARIGERIKAARLSKGYELEDVARLLHMRREYITSIESMQISQLPKGFVNPYIRAYASAVGLDPDYCVTSFREQCGALSQATPTALKVAEPKSYDALIRFGLAAAGLCLAAGIGYIGYKFVTAQPDRSVVSSSPAIAMTPSLDGANSPVIGYADVSGAVRRANLEIRAERRAWIEIRGADGTLFVDRQLSRGEVYDLRIDAGWTLTTQDAGAFVWLADGQVVMPVGEADQPLYTLGIDAIAAQIQKALDEQAASEQ
jgi:transcriptional regulator with XRE-family HTH domain